MSRNPGNQWRIRCSCVLVFLIVLGPLSAAAQYQDYGYKHISFRVQTEEPQLVITLGTHSVSDIPLPSLDPAAIERYRAQVMVEAGDAEPNIEITVAFRDYGFSGPINDAFIKQGRGVSFDPASLHSRGGIRHVGTLIIEDFSEDILKASFSGDLYYIGENNQPVMDRSVSGSFWISFPILNDPRAEDDLPESEEIRLQLASMWDLLRNMGFGLDDAGLAGTSGGPGGSPGAGAAAGAASGAAAVLECVCECDVLIALPDDDACIQPQGPCYQGLQICRTHGLDQTSAPASDDVEAILDRVLGQDAPQTVRAAMRESLLNISEAERAQLLEGFRQSDAVVPGQPAGSGEHVELQRALTRPGPPTDSRMVGVNPDWDAETLRYKAAVEQLGLPSDIVEEAVEMFHSNEAAMRAQLWLNVEAQLATKRGSGQ